MTLIHTAHSVVHCGLGISLAAGKCCAERISEQGSDLSLERRGDGVAAKTGEVSFDNSKFQKMCTFSSRQDTSEEAP
jgi:hypothetical protein